MLCFEESMFGNFLDLKGTVVRLEDTYFDAKKLGVRDGLAYRIEEIYMFKPILLTNSILENNFGFTKTVYKPHLDDIEMVLGISADQEVAFRSCAKNIENTSVALICRGMYATNWINDVHTLQNLLGILKNYKLEIKLPITCLNL